MKNIIFILICLCLSSVQAQTSNRGVEKLDSVYALLEQKVNNVGREAQFEMKFKMHLTYNINGAMDSLVYGGHVISDQNKKYFFEKDKRIYQDEKVTISVMEKTKEIHFFDTPPQEYLKIKKEKHQFLEDSLLAYANKVVYQGSDQIKLFFSEDNKYARGIRQITIKLHPDQILASIETLYYPGNTYARMHTVYESIDFDSKTKILNKKLETNIQKNGKLVSAYKNYTVYDHRKKN